MPRAVARAADVSLSEGLLGSLRVTCHRIELRLGIENDHLVASDFGYG